MVNAIRFSLDRSATDLLVFDFKAFRWKHTLTDIISINILFVCILIFR